MATTKIQSINNIINKVVLQHMWIIKYDICVCFKTSRRAVSYATDAVWTPFMVFYCGDHFVMKIKVGVVILMF